MPLPVSTRPTMRLLGQSQHWVVPPDLPVLVLTRWRAAGRIHESLCLRQSRSSQKWTYASFLRGRHMFSSDGPCSFLPGSSIPLEP